MISTTAVHNATADTTGAAEHRGVRTAPAPPADRTDGAGGAQTSAQDRGDRVSLSAEGLARGLQELVTTVQSEQGCTIQLTSNTDALGVLELRCPQDGRELVPAVMEFRRPAPDRLEVRSQLQFGPRFMHLAQDYQWKGACPQ